MRITSKGQVTIPNEIRKEMGFLPNTEVAFHISRGKVFLEKVKRPSNRGDGLIARMQGKAMVRMSTDEIMALTRR